jgi:hypothetical protein
MEDNTPCFVLSPEAGHDYWSSRGFPPSLCRRVLGQRLKQAMSTLHFVIHNQLNIRRYITYKAAEFAKLHVIYKPQLQ